MEEYKNGYHITKKNNLFNIQKNGLQPRIGRRSNSVDECNKILSFTPQLWNNKYLVLTEYYRKLKEKKC